MFGRKKKIGGGGYVKKNTQGTSNEISFSVLDAMKNSSDQENGEEQTPLGKIALFSLGRGKEPPATPGKESQFTVSGGGGGAKSSGTAGKSGFSSGSLSAEASVRKKRRMRSKASVIVLLLLVILALIGVAAYFAVHGIQNQMSHSDRMRLAIDDARGEIISLEGFELLLDQAEHQSLEALNDEGFVDRAKVAVNEVPSNLSKLREAKTQIESLQDGLFSPIESENANQALSDINEYMGILEQGKPLLEDVSNVVTCYQSALEYQSLLMEADRLAREAIEVSNNTTSEGFNEALQKSREAFEKFAAARDVASALINQSQALFEAAPINEQGSAQLLQPFVDYANLRVQSQEFAIAADEAFLNKNSAKIIEANNSYNDLETQAAELIAQQNGLFPADLIVEAFAQIRP